MTEEILKYNKMCAELVGYEVKYNKEFNEYSINGEPLSCFNFDSDWNYIMELFNAIENLQILNYINSKGFNCGTLKRIHTRIEYGLEVRKGQDFQGYICTIHPFTFSGHMFKGFHENDKKQAIFEAVSKFFIWYNEIKKS